MSTNQSKMQSSAQTVRGKATKKSTTYEELKIAYQQWMMNPVGTQSGFFKGTGWSRYDFFDEASRRGDDV